MSIKKLACLGGKPEFNERELLIRPVLPTLKEIAPRLEKVHESVFITNGEYNREFERIWKEKFNVDYAISVSNATIGLMIALKALAPEEGEVVLPPFTFAASGYSVLWNGLKPVFADIDEDTKNLSLPATKRMINGNTKVIMPVYIFSNPPLIKEFEELAKDHNLKLLFDTAQGIGSKYMSRYSGGFGHVEVFSLAPTKVVTAVEGGMITTNDEKLYLEMKALRDNGKTGEYEFTLQGLNGRMTEYQALVGIANLKRLDEFTLSRKKAVEKYMEILSPVPGISFQVPTEDCELTYNYMVIFIDEKKFGLSRDRLHDILSQENVQTKKYFYPLLNQMPPFAHCPKGDLTNSQKAAAQGLALPLYNNIDLEIVERTATLIKASR